MGGNYYIRNKNGVPLYGQRLTNINNVAGLNSNSTSEVVLSRILIPAGTLVDRGLGESPTYGPIGNLFRIETLTTKTGISGYLTTRIRIGTSGTITDSLVATSRSGSDNNSKSQIIRDLKVSRSDSNNLSFSYPSNQTNILINDLSVASVYPITFTTPTIPVSRISLLLSGYTHTYVSDVGMVLVSPTNKWSLIAGRIGGGNKTGGITPAVPINVTIGYTSPTPWNGFSSGNFRNNPTNGAGFQFSPAGGNPATLYFNTTETYNDLTTLNTSTPIGGDWKLYIQDFGSGDIGSLSGATLTFHFDRINSNTTTEVMSATTLNNRDVLYASNGLSSVPINWAVDNFISVTGQLDSSSDTMNCMYIYVNKYD